MFECSTVESTEMRRTKALSNAIARDLFEFQWRGENRGDRVDFISGLVEVTAEIFGEEFHEFVIGERQLFILIHDMDQITKDTS